MSQEFKFITGFAMKCNEEQFNSVVPKMIEMGREKIRSFYEDSGWIITNVGGYDKKFSAFHYDINNLQALRLEYWNEGLCLALSCMTDNPKGIAGEWFTSISNPNFYHQCKIGQMAKKESYFDMFSQFWRKSTVTEILDHFKENVNIQQEPFKENTEPITLIGYFDLTDLTSNEFKIKSNIPLDIGDLMKFTRNLIESELPSIFYSIGRPWYKGAMIIDDPLPVSKYGTTLGQKIQDNKIFEMFHDTIASRMKQVIKDSLIENKDIESEKLEKHVIENIQCDIKIDPSCMKESVYVNQKAKEIADIAKREKLDAKIIKVQKKLARLKDKRIKL